MKNPSNNVLSYPTHDLIPIQFPNGDDRKQIRQRIINGGK